MGPSHQARLPECQPNKLPADMVEKPEDWGELTWTPTAVLDSDLVMYLRAARSMAAFAGLCDGGSTEDAFTAASMDETTIKALDELHSSGYDTKRALGDLVKRINPKSYEKRWSEEDVKKFVKGLRIYGKNFFKIRKELVPNKETGELIEYYYYWKKTPAATMSRPHTRRRRRKQARTPTQQTSEECDASSASEMSEGEDSEYSDTSSSRDLNVYCRNCYTRNSNDWHHGGKHNHILCTRCRLHFEEHNEDRPVNGHKDAPHYLFQPVKEKRDLESPEECKSPSSDSVSSLSSSEHQSFDRQANKQKREAEMDDINKILKRSKPNERTESPSESYTSDSSSVFNENEENGNEGDVETNQDDATSTESSSPNEEVAQKHMPHTPTMYLNGIPRPIPKPAQPGVHHTSGQAVLQTVGGGGPAQIGHFSPQPNSHLKSPPSILQSMKPSHRDTHSQSRSSQPGLMHPMSGNIQSIAPDADISMPSDSVDVPGSHFSSHGSPFSNPGNHSQPIKRHVVPVSGQVHPTSHPLNAGQQPSNTSSQSSYDAETNRMAQQTGLFTQVNSTGNVRPLHSSTNSASGSRPGLLPTSFQGHPQPGIFTPSTQPVKTEVKSEFPSEGTEDSESSSEKSSESENGNDKVPTGGDSDTKQQETHQSMTSAFPNTEVQLDIKSIKKEPNESYPNDQPEQQHLATQNMQGSSSGGPPIHLHNIKQEPHLPPPHPAVVILPSHSSHENINRDYQHRLHPSSHLSAPQNPNQPPPTSNQTSNLPDVKPLLQVLNSSNQHSIPPPPPSHGNNPHIPPHLSKMQPHPLQMPHPHPSVRPQLPGSSSRPVSLQPGSTLPQPPPLVSVPQSHVPTSYPSSFVPSHSGPPSQQIHMHPHSNPQQDPQRMMSHYASGLPGGGKQDGSDRYMEERDRSIPRNGSPTTEFIPRSPKRERSRSPIRPETPESDIEPPRSPEPEATIVNEPIHKSKNAMFIKHWNRGWNSCSRCDFEFNPLPDSKLAKKREAQRLRRRSSSNSMNTSLSSSIKDERDMLKEEDRTAKKPETPPDNVTADAQITSTVMHSPRVGAGPYSRLVVSPRPPFPHPLSGDRTPALNQLSAYARHNLAAPGLDAQRGMHHYGLHHPHHPLDPYRLASMYPPGSREHLELELEREKRERDARERDLRERELRDMEFREKMKHEIEMKPPLGPGFERLLPPGANPMDPYWAEIMKKYSVLPGSFVGMPHQHLPGVYPPVSLASDLVNRERERLERHGVPTSHLPDQVIAERLAAERMQAGAIAAERMQAGAIAAERMQAGAIAAAEREHRERERIQAGSLAAAERIQQAGSIAAERMQAERLASLSMTDPLLRLSAAANDAQTHTHAHTHLHLHQPTQGEREALPPGHPLLESARQSELYYRDLLARQSYGAAAGDPVLAHQIASAQAAQVAAAQQAAVAQQEAIHRQILERERLGGPPGAPPHLR